MSRHPLLTAVISFTLLVVLNARAATDSELSNTISLTRTRLSLKFEPGSLRDCTTDNGLEGEETACKLDPRPDKDGMRRVKLAIFSAPKGPVGVEGELRFTYPLDIVFSSRDEHRSPFLKIGTDGLKGASFVVTKFGLPGPHGTTLVTKSAVLSVTANTELRDANQKSGGTIDFESTAFSLDNVQVGLPNTELALPVSMTSAGAVAVRLDLRTLRVDVRNGSFDAASLAFSSAQTVSANGLTFPIDAKPKLGGIRLSFSSGLATVTASRLGARPPQVSYQTKSSIVDANSIKEFLVGRLIYAVPHSSQSLAMLKDASQLEDVVCVGDIAISSVAGTKVVGGTGSVRVSRLYPAEVAGTLAMSAVTSFPQFGASLSPKATALGFDFSQKGSADFAVKGTARLSELVLGTMRFSTLSGPVLFQTAADRKGLQVTARDLGGAVRIEDPVTAAASRTGALFGPGRIAALKGRVLNLLSADRQFVAEKDDWKFEIKAPRVGTTLAGGPLSVNAQALAFSNERLSADAQQGIRGTFVSSKVPMSAPGLNVIPDIGGKSIRIGSATLSADAAFFTIDPDAASKAPFGLAGSFVATGLKAKFSPAIQLRANDLEFLTTDAGIERFTLTVSTVKANVRIEGLSIGAQSFTTTNKAKTESPSISGQFSAPFSIPLLEADLPYTPPVAMYNLKVRDARLALNNVRYKAVDGTQFAIPAATFDVKELGDDTIDAYLEVTDGTYSAPLAAPDSGTLDAKIRRLRMEAKGPRKPLKGFVELDVGPLRSKGIAAWRPLEGCCGSAGDANAANPNFTVPLQVDATIIRLFGRINFDGDQASGGLQSDGISAVTASYLGPELSADWEHNWTFQEEVQGSTDYPCFGTVTDPVRTCHAWTVLVPKIEASLRWHFKLNAIALNGGIDNIRLVPKMEDKVFSCPDDPDICPGGSVTRRVAVGVKQCEGHLTGLHPVTFVPLVRIYPDLINDGGDIAKVINQGWGNVVGVGESATLAVVATAASFFGPAFKLFGECH